ncbi:MAG: DNA mismatch repair endonuclease MutL, partial [Butyricicoccus sp.]|nr:DNA mismatch repair endonuclease MutL [Butyricicoccus sp.]
MPLIQELSPHLADLIAAGEVVERPASVAKELVENAIDAGATRIQVEMEHGGISYLRIMDNGCGMTAEDAPIAFRRHATSKLRTEADLSAIGTLGFRGEALAAIASVSRIDLFTKTKESLAGQHLHLEAGDIQLQEEAGCPDGTTIVIRDLFFNTPARMKFLKKDFTEAGYVTGVVEHAALSHPEIAFTLVRDGKQIFATAGDQKLITPVFSVFGREATANMVEVPVFQRDSLRAWGYITKPHYCRPNRSMQHFFVNGRYIKSRLLQAAVEEAYRNRMITGKYPSCALFLEMPLHLVDVNVHPAKTEVKFAQEKRVFEVVYIACKNALEQNDNIPVMQPSVQKRAVLKEDHITKEQQQIETPPPIEVKKKESPPLEPLFVPRKVSLPKNFRPPIIECEDDTDIVSVASPEISLVKSPLCGVQKIPHAVRNPVAEKNAIEKKDESENSSRSTASIFTSPAKVIGEAFRTYIIAQDDQGLILVDKHAAHERLLFNQLRTSTHMAQQQLLKPYIAELSAAEFVMVQEHVDTIRKIGFDLAPFGENSFAVRAVPAYLDAADVGEVLAEMADKLSSSRNPTPDRLDDLI